LVTSLDDPISNSEVIPYFEIKSNPHIILATTKHGGHLGWFRSGFDNILPRERWFPKPVGEFIHSIMESHLSLPVEDRVIHEHTGTPWLSIPHQFERNRLVKSNLMSDKKVDVVLSEEPMKMMVDKEVSTLPIKITIKSNSPVTNLPKVAKENLVMQVLGLFKISRWMVLFFILGFYSKRGYKILRKGIK
jgi:hypothetical protein